MKQVLILACLALVVASCRPETEFGAPVTPDQILAVKPQLLAGTWRLTRVFVVDNDAVSRGFPATSTVTNTPIQRLDVTNEFGFTGYRVTFNVNGATPSTFSVTPGTAPNFIGATSGNWTVDNNVFTSRISFGATPAQSFGVYRALQGGQNTIYLRYERLNATNNIVTSYEYEFTK
jgi:hypothetical protein